MPRYRGMHLLFNVAGRDLDCRVIRGMGARPDEVIIDGASVHLYNPLERGAARPCGGGAGIVGLAEYRTMLA